MIRIGVDVGGTNTDAVVMQSEKFLGGAKSPTTKDILSGVENAIKAALNEAKTESKDVKALIIGTTHFVNAIVQRNKLAKTGLIKLIIIIVNIESLFTHLTQKHYFAVKLSIHS